MRFNRTLWVLQSLLAAVFLAAGLVKLVLPIPPTEGPLVLPDAFLQFIGVVETLGAAGLILPMALGILPALTPVAAAGLTIVMVGAVVVTAVSMGPLMAALPGVVGVLTACVLWGRRSLLRAWFGRRDQRP